MDKKARKAKEVYAKTKRAEARFDHSTTGEKMVSQSAQKSKERYEKKDKVAADKAKAVEELAAAEEGTASGLATRLTNDYPGGDNEADDLDLESLLAVRWPPHAIQLGLGLG